MCARTDDSRQTCASWFGLECKTQSRCCFLVHPLIFASQRAQATRLAKALEDEKATNGKLVVRQKEELRAMQIAATAAENALHASRKESADLARRVKGQADAELAAAALRPRLVQLEAGLESRCEEVAFLRAELAKAQQVGLREVRGKQSCRNHWY